MQSSSISKSAPPAALPISATLDTAATAKTATAAAIAELEMLLTKIQVQKCKY
jgi:hypothetical protein